MIKEKEKRKKEVTLMISVKTKYALTLLTHLATTPTKKHTIKHLASHYKIPQKYLENITNILRKEGLLNSERGIHGGYTLAKPSKDITVYHLIMLLENNPTFNAGYCGTKTLSDYWASVDLNLKTRFNVSIQQLAEKQLKDVSAIHYAI